MSTEARRASFPPRPPVPPRPAHPPAPAPADRDPQNNQDSPHGPGPRTPAATDATGIASAAPTDGPGIPSAAPTDGPGLRNPGPTDGPGLTPPAPTVPRGRTAGGPGAFDGREPAAGPGAGGGSVPRGRTAGGTGLFDTRTPVPSTGGSDPSGPRGRTVDGTGAFQAREPRDGAAGTESGGTSAGAEAAGTAGGPSVYDVREPASGAVPGVAGPRGRTARGTGVFGAGEAADGGGAEGRTAGSAQSRDSRGPSVPRPRLTGPGGEVSPPPPPRASARFPDAPPTAGRSPHTPADTPSVPPQPTHGTGAPGSGVPPQSAHGTGAPGSGAPPQSPNRTGAPGSGAPSQSAHRTGAPGTGVPPESPSETTTPLRPVPADPDSRPGGTPSVPPVPSRPAPGAPRRPAQGSAHPSAAAPDPGLSWSAPPTPGRTAADARRPRVTFGEPEGYDVDARPRPLGRRNRSQVAAAAACLVLGTGLIGGAVAGSWLTGDADRPGSRGSFAAAGDMWHNVPVDQLFPPTVQGKGAGPGGADRFWTRIAVAPDSGCRDAFDPLLRKALAPVGCERLLRATYTDATQSHVTTVGLLFTTADAAGMTALADRFDRDRLDRRTDLMPLPYAAEGTAAAGFGARQRASWAISVLTDAPVVVYAVSGWADGRAVDTPQPAEDAMESGATTAPAQAGLGHEAQGLADRVERGLRKKAGTATERPS